ncbi:MAG TPA: chemotaxis protein CheW [Methylophilaceae bacterium]|jgi:twitching motility protein PilI
MARTRLDLHAYQQEILARLKESAEGGGVKAASRLGISINGQNWLVSLDDISEVLPMPEITPVPQTKSWFMGMTNVRGNLYALSDLAAYLGYPATKVDANCRILLVHPKFDINAGLLVQRLIGLRSTEDMDRQDEIGEQAAWYVNQYRDSNNEIWHEMDFGKLLSQNEFMQVAA